MGYSDEEITEEFRTFLDDEDYEGKQWKRAYYDFHAHLNLLAASRANVRVASATDGDSRGTVPNGTGTTRAQPTGHDRARSVSSAVPNPLGTSLRYESSKGVIEHEQSIPAVPVAGSCSVLKVDSEKERQRLLQEQKMLILGKYSKAAGESPAKAAAIGV